MHLVRRAATFILLAGMAIPAMPSSTARASRTEGQGTPTVMKNDDVIALAAAGLEDDVIVAKIRKSPQTNFDISVAGLKALKAAGISSRVIGVMIDPSQPVSTFVAGGTAATVATDTDDPMAPHTGLYVEKTGPDGKAHLVKILLTTSSGVKGPSFGSAMGSAYSFGIHKMKTKLLVPGTTSEVQTNNTSPTFWIYPGDDRSIQNTQLVRLEIKKDHREATGATIGAFSGVSVGGAEGANQGLKSEKIKDGVYKVTVRTPLAVGSYAFIEGFGGSYRDFDVVAAP